MKVCDIRLPWTGAVTSNSVAKGNQYMFDPGKTWVSEYSHKQGCFHVETLADALEKNRRAVAQGYEMDYIPFAVSITREDACDLCERMKKVRGDEADTGSDADW